MLHACFISLLLCFYHTSEYFYDFSGTNLLTKRRSASSRFLLFLVSEKLHLEYSRNWTKQKAEVPIFLRSFQSPEGGIAAPPPGVGPLVHLRLPPFAYIISVLRKPSGPERFSKKSSAAAVTENPSSGGFWSSSRHPVKEGNRRRRSSSSPCLPPMRCVSCSPQDYGSIAVAR
jgi:hypothetical protein